MFFVGLVVGIAVAGVAAFVLAAKRRNQIMEFVRNVGLEAVPAPTDDLESEIATMIQRLDAEQQLMLKRANEELRQREQALAGLEEGVVLLDRALRVKYANPAAAAILGGAIAGGRMRHTILTALAGEAGGEVQELAFEDPIHQRTFLASARLTDAGDKVIVVVRDETESRRLASVRRDFVADASHELKTPVAAIGAAIETVTLALSDGDINAASEFADKVRHSSERLSKLVSDLLDLSRLEAAVEQGSVVDLVRIVEREVNALGGSTPTPVFHAPDRALEVHGSPSDLALAIGNLVTNAVQYTDAGGRVTVRMIPEEDWVTVEVVDTGAGIPSKALPRIFERFYRVDPARSRATGGTGLGLSIVRHVVEHHGGSVSAASVLGEGSTFRIRLPLAKVSV